MSIYLQPNEFFDFDKKSVMNKAYEITNDLDSQKEKAIALFYWVRDEIKYNMALFVPKVKNYFIASKTIKRREGFCVSKSILLSTLARAVGIPARIHLCDLINHLVSQKIIDFMGHNVMYYHGYSEFYLNNKWVKLTPSFDKATALKGGFLPMVEFDGENDAVFPPYDVNGNKFGEYVRDRGVHADLPLDDIDKLFQEKYKMYRDHLSGFKRVENHKDLI
ncbi:MAG: transglutaminase-like domain-containing protein [Candidatus Hodarchaeota archaeon]